MPGMVTSRMVVSRRPRQEGGFAVRRGPRRSRRSLYVRTGAGLLALLLVAVAIRWALTAPFFAVTHITSGSYRFTSEAELQVAFNEFLGRNIWTLGSDEISDRIAQLPWIRDLRVLRRLPNRIEVDFREWSPRLAVESLSVDGRRHERLVILADGRLLDFPTHLVLPALAVLVGVQPVREGQGGQLRLPPPQETQLLELMSAMEDAGLEAACPVDFVVARPEGFAIVLQNGQGSLLLGREEFDPRLRRFMNARDHLEPGLDYDLRFRDRITVRAHH